MASIDSNMSELEALILREVDYVEKDVPLEFAKLASEIRNQLIGGNFKNRTGNLRRSIQVYEVDGNMIIEMLNYGYFISFGVNGRNRANALGLTEDVASAFGVQKGYKFGQQTQSNRVYGIDPRDFYPMDLENKLINILTNGDTAT
jgi:hypothetical protein